jgi:prephenate dehydrogenase
VVIGLGAIGGSLALALRRREVPVRGYDLDPEDRRRATAAGIDVPEGEAPTPELLADAAAIVIAVPIESVAAVAAAVLPLAPVAALVLHVASLQRPEALGIRDDLRPRVVGSHPLAGTHQGGFAGADAEMFVGALVFVEARADAATRRAAESLWRRVGAGRVEYRSAEDHDAEMAWVSHLPQLAAIAVAGALADRGTGSDVVGPGGRDTTRLAASPVALWAEILARAPDDTVVALDALQRRLAALREAVAVGDKAGLAREWAAGCAWRRTVAGPAA